MGDIGDNPRRYDVEPIEVPYAPPAPAKPAPVTPSVPVEPVKEPVPA